MKWATTEFTAHIGDSMAGLRASTVYSSCIEGPDADDLVASMRCAGA
jgi:hypothetical protein